MKELIEKLARVHALAFDYDGTIAPINVPRGESQVFPEIYTSLQSLSKYYKIVIASTKDCEFLMKRTPFAYAWICSNGFEIRFRDIAILPSTLLELDSGVVSELIQRINRISKEMNIYVELKRVGSLTVGICLDWRGKEVSSSVFDTIHSLASWAKEHGFHVIEYPSRPFIDIFFAKVDKGWALTKLIELHVIEKPIAYFGDSENDAPAFRLADISIQVVHEENRDLVLETDYRIYQESLPQLLRELLRYAEYKYKP